MSAVLEAPEHLQRHAITGRPLGIGDCATCNLIRLGYVAATAAERAATPKGAHR